MYLYTQMFANIFLHVVFDQWMEKNHPENPLKGMPTIWWYITKPRNRHSFFMLRQIKRRIAQCKLAWRQLSDLLT